MNINPKEDEVKIQSVVSVEILKFLQKECHKNNGVLTMKDLDQYTILQYGISLPEHIPSAYADKLIHETVGMIMGTLISVMNEYKLDSLTDHMFDVIVDKFDTTYVYNMIKDSQNQQGGEQR